MQFSRLLSLNLYLVKTKKIFMASFYEWVSTASRLEPLSRRQFTFYHYVPRNTWYSFYRPRRDETLSRPWSHPVVLKAGPHDWESSALTAKPLVKSWHWIWPKYYQQFWPKCFRKMTKCEDLYEAVLNNCLFHQYAVYLIFNFQVENLLGTMVSQLTKI